MSTIDAIRSICEIAVVVFIIYGLINEQKFIDFEDKVIRLIAKKIAIRKRKKAIAKKRALQAARRREQIAKQQVRSERAERAGVYRSVA